MTHDALLEHSLSAEVRKNRKVARNHFLMSLQTGKEFLSSSPGQFLMIRLRGVESFVLGRPMSIYAVEEMDGGAAVEILYQVAGRGTALISQLKKGDSVGLVGPLGKGFTVFPEKKQAVLIAGGMGIVPLSFLAQVYRGLPASNVEIVSYVGAQTDACFVGIDRLREFGRICVSSDDGSCGHRGFVTDLLERDVGSFDEDETVIYACGPGAMMRKVQEIGKDKRFACQASVEERMACGIGACLGCVFKLRNGRYARVCMEGPVFNIEELDFD